jgi:hypothetical protein
MDNELKVAALILQGKIGTAKEKRALKRILTKYVREQTSAHRVLKKLTRAIQR